MKQELNLRDIFSEFLCINGFKVAYAARQTGIPWTTISSWVRGERELSSQNKKKVREFLNGNFLVSVSEVEAYMRGEIE